MAINVSHKFGKKMKCFDLKKIDKLTARSTNRKNEISEWTGLTYSVNIFHSGEKKLSYNNDSVMGREAHYVSDYFITEFFLSVR